MNKDIKKAPKKEEVEKNKKTKQESSVQKETDKKRVKQIREDAVDKTVEAKKEIQDETQEGKVVNTVTPRVKQVRN